jgi:hypothetical protein
MAKVPVRVSQESKHHYPRWLSQWSWVPMTDRRSTTFTNSLDASRAAFGLGAQGAAGGVTEGTLMMFVVRVRGTVSMIVR